MSPKVWGLIPARIGSSRLKDKALRDLHGLPMVVHVAKRTQLAKSIDEVVVCTDHDGIAMACLKNGIKVCITPSACRNGTERIYVASERMDVSEDDIIIDVQGDEPLVDPEAIDKVVSQTIQNRENFDIVLPHLIGCPTDSVNYVKVVASGHNVLYLTRSDAPHPFSADPPLKKHLSVIGFSYGSLKQFYSLPQGELERVEGVELLRALEGGMTIFTFPVDGDTFSVDIEADLNRARRTLLNDDLFGSKY